MRNTQLEITHIITHKTMIKQRNISLIVVHCTASRCTSDLTPPSLDAMHKRQGFTECGYHYYITKDGRIHHMRDITKIGAHVKRHNKESLTKEVLTHQAKQPTHVPPHKNKALKRSCAFCYSPIREQRSAAIVI